MTIFHRNHRTHEFKALFNSPYISSLDMYMYIYTFYSIDEVKDVTRYSKMTFSHVLISYVCVNKWKCKYRLISNTYYFPINHFAYEAVILSNLIAGFIYLSVYVICMYRIILMNLNVTKPFTKKLFNEINLWTTFCLRVVPKITWCIDITVARCYPLLTLMI